jgi:hypothetical protein
MLAVRQHLAVSLTLVLACFGHQQQIRAAIAAILLVLLGCVQHAPVVFQPYSCFLGIAAEGLGAILIGR